MVQVPLAQITWYHHISLLHEVDDNMYSVRVALPQDMKDDATEKTTEKTTEKILSLIKKNPTITLDELATVCGLTPDGVYYHTKKMREAGILHREGGRKDGKWVIDCD